MGSEMCIRDRSRGQIWNAPLRITASSLAGADTSSRQPRQSLLFCRQSFRNKRIKVNGKRAEPDTRLSAGDLIELYINDEFFPVGKPTAKTAKPRRQPPVTVVYEDENFAVLYKPAHLLCHSDRTGDANLVDAFAAYLETKGEYDPHAEKRFAPALCNRLDLSLIHI